MLVDTCILLDILTGSPLAESSLRALERIPAGNGGATINPIIYAEVARFFTLREKSQPELDDFLKQAGIHPAEIPLAACWRAAELAATAGLSRRERILPDYLIVAHALISGGLLTRDQGLRTFARFGLKILSP